MNPDCPHLPEVPHLLTGEPAGREAERHLRECATCSGEAAAVRSILTRLRSAPEAPALPDLAPRILAGIRQEKAARAARLRLLRQVGAAAAAVAVAATALRHFRSPAAAPVQAVAGSGAVPGAAAGASVGLAARESFERALDWLCQNQEGDGSWDAARWGGQNRFRVSLTALCTLALLSAEADSPHRTEPAARAVTWLARQQRPDGCFGASPSVEPYDHTLALLALLKADARGMTTLGTDALTDALGQLLHQPTPERVRADPLLARWNFSAVELAAARGLTGAAGAVARFAEAAERTRAARPQSAPDAGLDFYNACFLAGCAPGDAGEAGRRQALVAALSGQQSREGPASGSWPPDARWGRAGGRVYSTALAALSISSAGLE